MRRTLLVGLVVMLLTLLLAPLAQAATLLSYGSTGSEVVTVQTELAQLGYDVGTVDGIFGSKTLAAVKSFQSTHNLVADGIVGPLTSQTLTKALRDKNTQGIISTAQSLTGVPYLWGGATPSGFDCSGYTQFVFGKNGITLLRSSTQQYTMGTPIDFVNLLPGDLVFFNFIQGQTISHVGIYLGNNQFISATTSKGVTTYSFSPYWTNAYVGARRVY